MGHPALIGERKPKDFWQVLWLDRGGEQSHPRFARGASAFALIAGDAGNHHVGPVSRSAADPRNDVIIRGLVPSDFVAAVLASALVPGIDAFARKLDRFLASPKRP